MAKRTASFELTLPPREPDTPAYRWLYEALRAEILEGRLRPGARLPGTRDLADRYGLSRGTIVNAFEQLKSEGYVDGSVGSGTHVSTILPDELLQAPRPAAQPREGRPRRHLSDFGRRVRSLPGLDVRPTRAFRSDLPALDLFPTTLWAQIASRRLRSVSASLLLGCETLGYKPLREAVADYLNASRGVKCVPEQVMIVSGTQEALDLAARIFLNPGDRVCMEDPGYIGASGTFEAAGAKIDGIPVDAEGMQIPDGKARLV